MDFMWTELKGGPSDFLQEVSNRKDGSALIHCSEIIPEGVEQHLFCVRQVKARDWPDWEELLVRFSESQRSEDEFKRNVMLLHLEHGEFSEPVGAQFDACSLHDHLVGDDAYFAASRLIKGGASRTLKDEIRIHIAAELALWDFDLCRFLCDATIEELVNPSDLLLRYADNRKDGNQSPDKMFEPAWSSTFRNRKSPVHSVLVAQARNTVELTRRVWRGQVQVLFPLIEEQRCLLVDQLKKRAPAVLRKGEELRFQLIEQNRQRLPAVLGNSADPDGPIEVGLLHHAMVLVQKYPSDLKKCAWRLMTMRNKLAHLEVCHSRDLPAPNELLT